MYCHWLGKSQSAVFIMAGAGRLTAAEAIRSLQAVDSDCSCDEDDDNTAQSAMQASFENFDLSDSDSDDSEPPDFRNDYGGQSSSNQWDNFQVEQAFLESGSAALQTEVELQLKTYFQKDQDQHHILRDVKSDSPLSAFSLFVDEPVLRSNLKFTMKHW